MFLGHKGPSSGNNLTEFGGLDGNKIKQEPSGNGMNLSMMSSSHHHQHHHGVFLEENALTNMELTNILQGRETEKPPSSKRQHKRKAVEDLWKTSTSTTKRKTIIDDAELLMETSSNDSTSRSTPLSQETTVSEIPTPNSALGFHSDLELSGLDPAELIGDDKSGEFDNLDELSDVEEMLSSSSKSGRKHDKSPLLMDLGDSKSLVSPSVSITPISTTSSSPGGGGGGYKSNIRSGIEIIPISSSGTTGATLPSSITITPIASGSSSSSVKEERVREKKSSKYRSDEKNRMEKKKKRKREENAMGPPDKLPITKQDAVTNKPVTVSIKATTESPPSPSSMIRKFNQSPTQNRNLSPSLLKPTLKSSPKHSPAHHMSSPKHIGGISSPKSHGTSPSTGGGGGSSSGGGKPSMSALKNAANSPSPSNKSGGESSSSSSSKTSSNSKSFNKESSFRDKEKKLSSSVFPSSNCAKIKSSVKMKSLDSGGGGGDDATIQDGGCLQINAIDGGKSSNMMRNRKGNLLAVIDKLKSAQHCDSPADLSGKSSRDRSQISNKSSSESGGGKTNVKSGETKNSEYMVKPSSDGMKITINKTRMKDSSITKSSSSSSSSITNKSSGSGSPKTHTGLKPGVNSGPASKKPTLNLGNQKVSSGSNSPVYKSKSSSSSSTSSSSSSSKTTSTTSILNKSSSKIGSPKLNSTATDLSRNKDKQKPSNKSSTEKSIFTMKESRKSSPTPSKDESDGERSYKLPVTSYSSPLTMEGLMKQQFDKNFQIPKLSARLTDEKKLKINPTTADNIINNMNKTERNHDVKYPLALASVAKLTNENDKLRNNLNNMVSPLSSVDPKLISSTKDDLEIDRRDSKSDEYRINYPISVPKSISEPLSLSTKAAAAADTSSSTTTTKFIAPAPKDDRKDNNKCKSDGEQLLLDFSNKTEQQQQNKGSSASPYPQSPSVSVHIVKSPAPSPLINPSPHSTSPSCITDDELMDEALVGLGK